MYAKNRQYKLYIASVLLLLMISVVNLSVNKINDSQSTIEKSDLIPPTSSDIFDQGILYSGAQDSLVVNETAIYTETSQLSIGNGSNPEYTSQTLEFPLDDTNSWEGYLYSANITNLVDENDWISNGNFGSDNGITYTAHNVQTFQSTHPYSNNLDSDPSIGGNIIATIDGSGCDYMRLHFANISTQGIYDTIYLWDQDNTPLNWYSGVYEDLLTPWMNASTIKITMESDGSTNDYGFYIDYFETYNGALFTYSMDDWNAYSVGSDLSEMNAIPGHQLNQSAINVTLAGTHLTGRTYNYVQDEESGIYQELSIPRGSVENAWISFDYYPLRIFPQSKIEVNVKINGADAYTRNLATIWSDGLGNWHNTGLVPISTGLFSNPVSEQTVNVSLSLYVHNTRTCSGDFADLQEIYFDNIELILQTTVNSTQPEINLQFNGISPTDSVSEWGNSTLNHFYTWTTSPIAINVTTDCEKVVFTLESALYATHIAVSKQEEYGVDGSNLVIYSNNSIEWRTYFRAFIPLMYNEYAFAGQKPLDWEILGVHNPLGNPAAFSGGGQGDSTFVVPDPTSNYPGWWSFIARSTNMISASSTSLWNGTDWQNYIEPLNFNISNIVRIKTSLNTSTGNIGNNDTTTANLTIYDPNGEIWFNGGVTPETSGEIYFPNLTIGTTNSSAGKYQYKIFWMNGTSAGGLNGSFYIYRNLQATILYPRDASVDFEIEAILGDIIPLRISLNDSFSGALGTDLQVTYSWESGSNNLIEIIAGNYDGNFDTLNLITPGIHELNFTAWGFGYYNLSFTLTINLVEETELKIVGLDNNIDYGTNFTIEITYKSKPLSIGIPDAEIVLNLSSNYYSVSESGQVGKYNIEISSEDAFPGAGSYDILINASATHCQPQDIVTRIQVLPRSVYFEIFIDSNDISFNKSYSTHIKQMLNISVGVKSSSDNLPILSGAMYMTDGQHIYDDFSLVGDYYFMEINSSNFGLGVRFISIIFNETTYQSGSEIIMLSVTRLPMSASLYNTDPVLNPIRNTKFEVSIYVEDPVTHLPIFDVEVAYDWTFGRGFLTNLGNGYFKFEETAPRELKSYEIVITVSSPNVDYEPSTVVVILVPQPPDNPYLKWILLGVGSIALITTGILAYLSYKRNVLIPKKEREINLLKKKTQVFDDITIIKSVLIIETNTGRLMYRYVLGGLDADNEDIFSGFLHAILTLSNRFALKNGDLGDRKEYAEFTHEAFHVLVAAGQKVIIALILEQESSAELQERAFKFLDEFEGIYASILKSWNGDRSVFNKTTPKLFEEIFHLSLLKRFKLTDAENIYLLEKTLIVPNTISEKVAQIIKTISEERNDFRLRTLISLIPQDEQLQAKDMILRFIKSKYLVPVD